jgi:hypothetical protein
MPVVLVRRNCIKKSLKGVAFNTDSCSFVILFQVVLVTRFLKEKKCSLNMDIYHHKKWRDC